VLATDALGGLFMSDDLRALRVYAGYVVLGLVVFSVVVRPDQGMVTTLLGALSAWLGLYWLERREGRR
jgi:hypothetical protein